MQNVVINALCLTEFYGIERMCMKSPLAPGHVLNKDRCCYCGVSISVITGAPCLPLNLFRSNRGGWRGSSWARGEAVLTAVCTSSMEQREYQLLPPPPTGLSLPWPRALLSVPSGPGPLTFGIILQGLPVPSARIFVALGVVLNPALSSLLSQS